MLGCRVITTMGWGGSVSSLREIIIWMLALEDCDVVTASGWEWSNPHPPNIDNP